MSLFIHTDVTAVKLFDNFIITGIGSSISVYKKDSFEFLDRICCLTGQKVYGILPLEGTGFILVFGGKQYTVVSVECLEKGCEGSVKFSRIFEAVVCDDWLHSAAWVNHNSVAVLTAHNSIQIWDITSQTLSHQHLSTENSILYSGLLLPLQDGLLALAGTVFSEIIVHVPTDDEPLHQLKGHRGVIFSISCYPEKHIMVSTSDDRSVRIWGINLTNPDLKLVQNTTDYWRNISIICRHEVYGHAARVMRSCITDDLIMSVGEDSAVCFWDYNGKLLRKHVTHQNSGIWSVDADNANVVTGGGDGAVITHPLMMALEYGRQESLHLDTKAQVIPKKVAFTARKNLVVLDESEDVIHYINVDNKTTETHKLNHGSTNKFLSVSSCKQLIAVANMSGTLDVFVESCKDEECIRNILSTNLNSRPLLSMQWIGSRHLIFCTANGNITVLSSDKYEIDIYANFILPPCKERWLTAAAMHSNNNVIVGDRCGNIHIFVKGNTNPIKTFHSVHGRYGPTSITVTQGEFITTGRDGTIKYFSLDENKSDLAKYMSSKDVEFQWVEKFIDKEQNVICGFKERIFVIYNVRTNLKLVEIPCGGGHRTWDVIRYIDKADDKYDEFIRLVYVKNNNLFTHTFQTSTVASKNVINSTHSKEINCLKSFKSDFDQSVTFYVTGGEDTTLRISSLDSKQVFCDEVVFKHLSNVRTLKTIEQQDKIIVVSAGGRAQICVKLINVRKEDNGIKFTSEELVSHLIKGIDKDRKNNQSWKDCTIDFDPETRIMDLDLITLENNKLLIFAGCSDACLRVFQFNEMNTFEAVAELTHHKTCILKVTCIQFLGKDLLITCTTRGEVSLWNVTDIESWGNLTPFFTMRTNKCGINGIDTKITDDKLLIVTGGDDNAIHLSVLEAPNMDLHSMSVKHKWSTDEFHCSQITGVKLVDDSLLSTSIDQRVTVSKLRIDQDGVNCEFKAQVYSDIADIQGMELLSNSSDTLTVCVFGKGMEVLEVPKVWSVR